MPECRTEAQPVAFEALEGPAAPPVAVWNRRQRGRSAGLQARHVLDRYFSLGCVWARPRTRSYNGSAVIYNGEMSAVSYIMTVSQNGQVSIPADARSRWKARRVVVVDLGDRVVVRPLRDDGVEELEGKYRGRGPTADVARRQARQEEAARATGH